MQSTSVFMSGDKSGNPNKWSTQSVCSENDDFCTEETYFRGTDGYFRPWYKRVHNRRYVCFGLGIDQWCFGILLLLLAAGILAAIMAPVIWEAMAGASGGASCLLVTYIVTLRIPTMAYVSSLSNPLSPEYKQLEAQVCHNLTDGLVTDGILYQDEGRCGKVTDDCEVVTFKSGSVIVDLFLRHALYLKSPLSEADKTRLELTMNNAILDVIQKAQRIGDSSNVFSYNEVSDVKTEIYEERQIGSCILSNFPDGASLSPGTSFSFGTSVTITCNAGYELPSGGKSQTLQCLESGLFDTEAKDCKAMTCPTLTAPFYSSLVQGSLFNNVHKSVVTFKCDAGYSFMVGGLKMSTMSLTCSDNGVWDNELESCTYTGCQDLVVPRNAKKISGELSGNAENMKTVFQCFEGYSFTADDYSDTILIMTCQDDGEYDVSIKDCVDATCEDLVPPEQGHLEAGSLSNNAPGNIAVFRCNEGYSFSKSDPQDTVMSLECQPEDYTYDKAVGTCHAIVCPTVVLPENTTLVGGELENNNPHDFVTIGCKPGLIFASGETVLDISCDLLGEWNREVGPCGDHHEHFGIVEFCPDITGVGSTVDVVTGELTNVARGNNVVFKCKEGFSLDPANYKDNYFSMECRDDGTYLGSVKSCSLVTCPDLDLASMLRRRVSGSETGNRFGDQVRTTCNEGTVIYIGPSTTTMTCNALGEWDVKIGTCYEAQENLFP